MKLFFHFITLFPETIDPWMQTSIIGRARQQGLFDYRCYQLRDYAIDKHRSVDDVAYGGGGGMVLRIEPLVAAVEAIRAQCAEHSVEVIYFSPAGERLTQQAFDHAVPKQGCRHFILICGHYEGVDQRFIDGWVDREISLGDFVLSGGELPAVAFADAAIRQIEGVLGADHTAAHESFSLKSPAGKPLLEYPHYTRPATFQGREVPEVLLSGNHQAIERWRASESTQRTQKRRPDLTPAPINNN